MDIQIKKLFEARRSIRRFKEKPVSDKDIQQILWAASLAPTARNIQPWEFVVITEKIALKEIGRIVSPNGAFISQAPVCIVIFCKDTKYYLEDGCAATTQALLCVSASGLGACWVAGDKKDYCENIKELLKVPAGYKLISLIALGHPDESQVHEKRKLEDMIHRDRF